LARVATQDQRFFGLGDYRQHIANMGLGSHKKDVFQIRAFGFDRPGVRTHLQ
jgi:hypothetical protein